MRAVLLHGHGGLEKLEYRDDVPVPRPAAGEVLVRIGAAALNNTDINTRIGWYSKAVTGATAAGAPQTQAQDSAWGGGAVRFPRIQGADGCGQIVAVGSGVDPVRVGERVLIDPLLRPTGALARTEYFGSDRDGAFAEFTAVPAANARRVTSALSDVQLASFPCSYAAAENMLARTELAAGETVLVTGASGGVGSAAVQLGRRRHAQVLALASLPKAAAVRALGAAQVLPRDSDLLAELGHESVDAVIDVAGGRQFPQLLQVLRPGGRYAVAGAIAGPVVELDLRTLYLKDLRLFGCTAYEPALFGDLLGYIERGEIRPVVSATHALRDIAAAQSEFLRKSHTGKIVLTL
ncbi:MAG: alcohol dehydrogenase family protein [Gammaproteobacteria bacterium]|nr:alcohol dehydrogenase family protein [Gammaproteobacteria bacterium]